MIIGIDIGTSTSSAAFMDGSDARIIPNRYGAVVTPSVVSWSESRGYLVGEEALKQRVTGYPRTVHGIKRRMGSSHPVQIGKKILTPTQITSIIIKKIVMDAGAFLGQPVTGAVITVPAHFSELQRRATKEAAHLAGLKKIRLINEPTAAALAWGDKVSGTCAVFDFGGGTLDIAIMKVDGSKSAVHGVNGDAKLGGMDFTRKMYALIRSRIDNSVKIEGEYQARLLEIAEEAKVALSSVSETLVQLPWGKKLRITRSEFEKAAAPLVHNALSVLKAALKQGNWQNKDIGTVIFAGGTSRIPLVQDSVVHFLGHGVKKRSSPAEIVALGAAAAAGVKAASSGGIREVLPYDLGIEIEGGKTLRLAERNTPLPFTVKRVFTTLRENQRTVEIHLLQGGYLEAGRNLSLGKVQLNSIQAAPRGVPKIEVEFSIDADGLLLLNARDTASAVSRQLRLPRIITVKRESPGKVYSISGLAEVVRLECIKFAPLIDVNLKQDIDDILDIADSVINGKNRAWERECSIALTTILREIRSINTDREAGCAG